MNDTGSKTPSISEAMPSIEEVLPRLSEEDARIVRRLVAQYERNHNQLKESWDHLRLAFQAASIGTFEWDIVNNINDWSPEVIAIFGTTAEAFGGDYDAYLGFIPAEAREAVDRKVRAFMATAGNSDVLVYDHEIIRADGRRGWIEVRARLFLDEAGTPLRYSGIAIDISERKRLREEAQKAQRLESLGFLAGGIAHDFNNLLSGIFGYLEMAKECTALSEAVEYIRKSEGVIDRARHLTLQLLTFAKGGTPAKTKADLTPLLKETTTFALSGANITCQMDIAGDLWGGDFDQHQMAQVMDNLLTNAQQAMPRGGHVRVAARNVVLSGGEHQSGRAGSFVQISVSDQGPGISPEVMNHIFDPFYSTKAGGHGLGLATSHSIINQHDGFIAVESEVGRGATFHVFLPAAPLSAIADSRPPKTTGGHRGEGVVIVMDDEPVLRETLAAMLTSLGYTPYCRDSGDAALECLVELNHSGRSPVAIFSDLTVPRGMGGREMVRKIREMDEDLPLFVTSGYSADPIMAFPEEHGFTASLRKPFLKSDLIALLNRHLR